MRHAAQKSYTNNFLRRGFTIVELLVVIVVIGILAAVTIVAYSGIQQRARTATVQTDVKNAANQLVNDNTTNSSYPASTAAANGGLGLKASSGTTYQYDYFSSNNTYCLTGTNGLTSYFSSSANPTPQSGTCPGQLIGIVTTLAGSIQGSADGTGSAAQFNSPTAVAVDTSGTVYVADLNNQLIRKITSAGVVTTLAGSVAGSADGTGSAAQFNNPRGVAVDAAGTVYVGDTANYSIRKITPAGVVTTMAGGTLGTADGTGSAAQFNIPSGVVVDSSGTVFVADAGNHRIRKITPAGVVTTLAGSVAGSADGTGSAAQFYYPRYVAVDSAGMVYVADTSNQRIRKITPAGVVTTFAGSSQGYADGTGTAAQFNAPGGVAIDTSGTVYAADLNNQRIRKITPAGVVTTLAGSTQGYADGTGTAAKFWTPYGVAVDPLGTVYVVDNGNNRIRKIQ